MDFSSLLGSILQGLPGMGGGQQATQYPAFMQPQTSQPWAATALNPALSQPQIPVNTNPLMPPSSSTMDPSAAVHRALQSPDAQTGMQDVQQTAAQQAAHDAMIQGIQQSLGSFLQNLGKSASNHQQPQMMQVPSLPMVQAQPWQMHMPALMMYGRGAGGY